MLTGEGPTLLGRDWMQHIQLDWPSIFQIKTIKDNSLQQLLQPFEAVFKEELGTFTGDKVTIHLDLSVVPKFCKARPLPYSMKEMVEKRVTKIGKLGSHKASEVFEMGRTNCTRLEVRSEVHQDLWRL